jgi:hypothetical protein
MNTIPFLVLVSFFVMLGIVAMATARSQYKTKIKRLYGRFYN